MRARFARFSAALWLMSISWALGSLAPLPHARAEAASVEAEVLVILGSSEGEGVDPELQTLPALQEPPFDSFKKKQLLSSKKVQLEENVAHELTLPNGRKLQLVWLGKGDEGRYRVQVSINRPGKQDYLPVMTVAAAPGDPFFVAGQKHQGGTLIIGVRVGKGAK